MTEERLAPNWKNPIIWSAALLISVIAEMPVAGGFGPESAKTMKVLWDLLNFVLAWVTFFNWHTQLERSPKSNASETESHRLPFHFLVVALILAVGGGVIYLVFGFEAAVSSYMLWYVAIFAYIAVIFLVRNLLIELARIISSKPVVADDDQYKEAFNRRVGSGIADAILIIGHMVALFIINGGIRFIILAIVIAGIRVGWGFIPIERLEIVSEFIVFLRERKLWWMTPIFLILGLLVVLVLLTESTGGSFPFIYAIF